MTIRELLPTVVGGVLLVPVAVLTLYFISRAISYGWHMGKFSALFRQRLRNEEMNHECDTKKGETNHE